MASGDRAGRVVLFQRNYSKKSCEYKFYSEFQSHEPEFDYLKSLEINERINKLSWLPRTHNAHFILSTNDKTIKLWKIKERQVQSVLENNLSLSQRSGGAGNGLTLPKVISREKVVAATPKRIFSSAHAYNIHSISPSSDGEIFISSDDLRINLWNLNSSEIAFNVVDCKPPTIEDLTEVITSATFHPSLGNLFMYSTSRGNLRLCDLRDSALCDQSSLNFGGGPSSTGSNGFFDEIISSVTDVKFSPTDPNRFLSRDYLHTHLWDMRMDSGPLLSSPIHDHIRPRLCDLYENDSVFDKFECSFNYDGSSIISGSYNNFLKVSALSDDSPRTVTTTTDDLIHADKSIFRNPSALKRTKSSVNGAPGSISNAASKSTSSLKKLSTSRDDFTNLAGLDFSKKILHFSAHPSENSVAIASASNLFIFSQL